MRQRSSGPTPPIPCRGTSPTLTRPHSPILRPSAPTWTAFSGGHIGYDVRPSARRPGHATAMLAAALPVARSLGISEALLTCLDTNIGSRRVIEANGGQFIGISGPKRRYLVPAG